MLHSAPEIIRFDTINLIIELINKKITKLSKLSKLHELYRN